MFRTSEAGFSVFFAVFLIVSAVSAIDSEDASPERLTELQDRLKSIEQEFAVVSRQIADKNREYNRFKHDILYTNSLPAQLYKEIVFLEKQLQDKRDELHKVTLQCPGVDEMLEEQRELYRRKKQLLERKGLVENEIKAVMLRIQANTPQKKREK